MISGCLSGAPLKARRRQVDWPDQLLVPSDRKAVSHPGDEVADRAELLLRLIFALPRGWQQRGIGTVSLGKIGDDPLRLLADRLERRKVVEPLMEEALESPLLLSQSI